MQTDAIAEEVYAAIRLFVEKLLFYKKVNFKKRAACEDPAYMGVIGNGMDVFNYFFISSNPFF